MKERVSEIPISGQPIAPTAPDLANLEQMSRDELLALVKRLPVVPVAHALLTKDEKRERMKAKVYGIAMESTNEASILKAANDWLDREDGKPKSSMELTGKEGAPLSMRLIEAQQRLLVDVTPIPVVLGYSAPNVK